MRGKKPRSKLKQKTAVKDGFCFVFFLPQSSGEMAQSPQCGPAAAADWSPRHAPTDSRLILLNGLFPRASSTSLERRLPLEPASQPASTHPAARQAGGRALPSHHRCAVLLLHLEGECEEEGGDNEKKKRIFCRPKVSYWVPVGRAMGQRAVRPKLHRQYIMPLESNQLSEMGS